LDHVAVNLGLFVAQIKLKTLVIRNMLNIYHAYAEMGVAFLGLQSFCWIYYLWFYICGGDQFTWNFYQM